MTDNTIATFDQLHAIYQEFIITHHGRLILAFARDNISFDYDYKKWGYQVDTSTVWILPNGYDGDIEVVHVLDGSKL